MRLYRKSRYLCVCSESWLSMSVDILDQWDEIFWLSSLCFPLGSMSYFWVIIIHTCSILLPKNATRKGHEYIVCVCSGLFLWILCHGSYINACSSLLLCYRILGSRSFEGPFHYTRRLLYEVFLDIYSLLNCLCMLLDN